MNFAIAMNVIYAEKALREERNAEVKDESQAVAYSFKKAPRKTIFDLFAQLFA